MDRHSLSNHGFYHPEGNQSPPEAYPSTVPVSHHQMRSNQALRPVTLFTIQSFIESFLPLNLELSAFSHRFFLEFVVIIAMRTSGIIECHSYCPRLVQRLVIAFIQD